MKSTLMKNMLALISMARRVGKRELAQRLATEYNRLLLEERKKKQPKP